jgi:hypothetical protein
VGATEDSKSTKKVKLKMYKRNLTKTRITRDFRNFKKYFCIEQTRNFCFVKIKKISAFYSNVHDIHGNIYEL